ncbi:MAG: hypothetical protein EOP06_19625, partial [Proteobacteria bacterium]
MSRFDYVKYDETSDEHQKDLKALVQTVETRLGAIPSSRYTSLAITALEEVYMWIGKAIREDQIKRNGS